jgi:hypothetical protein
MQRRQAVPECLPRWSSATSPRILRASTGSGHPLAVATQSGRGTTARDNSGQKAQTGATTRRRADQPRQPELTEQINRETAEPARTLPGNQTKNSSHQSN